MVQKWACPCHKDQLHLCDRTLIDTLTQLSKFLSGSAPGESGGWWTQETLKCHYVGPVLVGCLSTWHELESPEKTDGKLRLNWENSSIRFPIDKLVGHFFIMIDLGWPTHCGWHHPWTGGPRCYRKKTEQAMGASREITFLHASVPASGFLPCLSSCLGFSPWWTLIRWESQMNPFLAKLLLVMVSVLQQEKPNKKRHPATWQDHICVHH